MNALNKASEIDYTEVLQPTPFQSRVNDLCLVENWTGGMDKIARVYDTLTSEYFAIRSTCGVMDLTPMEKYRISGPDALVFLTDWLHEIYLA